MSIEDAKDELRLLMADNYSSEKIDDAALDRLILEVKASLPCFVAWVEGEEIQHAETCNSWEPQSEVNGHCPSCEARRELKVPT